jgi:DNA-binding protein H-NS
MCIESRHPLKYEAISHFAEREPNIHKIRALERAKRTTPMSTYQDLLAQKALLDKQTAELEKQLQDARRAERAGVIAQIKSLLAEHGLSVADLGTKVGKAPSVPGTSAAAGRKVAPKYRNSDTGETWTGRGLQPKWVQAAVASGKTLADFTI